MNSPETKHQVDKDDNVQSSLPSNQQDVGNKTSSKPVKKYKAFDRFNDPNSDEFKKRMNTQLMHTLSPIMELNEQGNRRK